MTTRQECIDAIHHHATSASRWLAELSAALREGYDPPAVCAEGDCVRHATYNQGGRLVCAEHAEDRP